MVLPKGSMLPTSRRARLLRVLRAHAAAGGVPPTFKEIRSLYARVHEDALDGEALHSALGALLHGGEVLRVGRRDGNVVYRAALPAVETSSVSSIDREMRTMARRASRVVADLYREKGVPIPTAWISAELKRRKLWPDRFQRLTLVLTRLEESTAVVEGAIPGIRRVASRTLRGSARVAWIPADASARHGAVPQHHTDSVRRTVHAAAKAAGRPVSWRELRWWLAAQSDVRVDRSLGKRLKNVAYRDASQPSGPAIRVIAGPLACHGGAPSRYYLGSPARLQRDACRITDASTILRVAEESLGIAAARVAASGSDPLRRFISLRESLLKHAWHAHAGPEPAEALALAIRAAETTAAWSIRAARGSDGARQDRARQSARLRADLVASKQLLDGTRDECALNNGRPRGVGETATVSLGELRELTELLTEAGELRLVRPEAAYADARRLPIRRSAASTPLASSPGIQSGERFAVVDRVDSLLGIMQHVVAMRAAPLVTEAAALLGHVVRDASVLIELLERLRWDTTRDRAYERRLVVIALGMLGVVAEHRGAFPPRPTHEDMNAYMLGVLCSTWRTDLTLTHVNEASRRLPLSLREMLPGFDRALRSGRFFSAIDSAI